MRYYLPREDVAVDLVRSDHETTCAYKGHATHWSVGSDPDLQSIAWTYEEPLSDALPVAGLVAFYTERLDLAIDGTPLPRPVTPWSRRRRLTFGRRTSALPGSLLARESLLVRAVPRVRSGSTVSRDGRSRHDDADRSPGPTAPTVTACWSITMTTSWWRAPVPSSSGAWHSGGQVLVHGTRDRVGLMRGVLGTHPRLEYGFDEDLYQAPTRTLFAYQRRLAEIGEGTEFWVTGTVPLGRDAAERAAWARYESAVNEALGAYPFRALCTYDARTLPASVIAAARATHPIVSTDLTSQHQPRLPRSGSVPGHSARGRARAPVFATVPGDLRRQLRPAGEGPLPAQHRPPASRARCHSSRSTSSSPR